MATRNDQKWPILGHKNVNIFVKYCAIFKIFFFPLSLQHSLVENCMVISLLLIAEALGPRNAVQFESVHLIVK